MRWWRWISIIAGGMAGSFFFNWVLAYWNGLSVTLDLAASLGVAAYFDLRTRLDSHRHLGPDLAPANTFYREKP